MNHPPRSGVAIVSAEAFVNADSCVGQSEDLGHIGGLRRFAQLTARPVPAASWRNAHLGCAADGGVHAKGVDECPSPASDLIAGAIGACRQDRTCTNDVADLGAAANPRGRRRGSRGVTSGSTRLSF